MPSLVVDERSVLQTRRNARCWYCFLPVNEPTWGGPYSWAGALGFDANIGAAGSTGGRVSLVIKTAHLQAATGRLSRCIQARIGLTQIITQGRI